MSQRLGAMRVPGARSADRRAPASPVRGAEDGGRWRRRCAARARAGGR